jgi:phage FluMu protein Com
MIQCDVCSKIYSNKEYKSCPTCKFNDCGKENTQGLIQKDLLLDFPDKDKPLTSECPKCKRIFEYYPEDPNPVGEEGWCYTCVFGVDDYDEPY